jgi:hypothetical protein
MAKTLTDTALTILTTAAGRDNRRVLPLPKLKAPPVAVQKTLRSMIADGLVEEIAATPDDAVWEQSDNQGRRTLVVTGAGLAAVGIADVGPTKAERSRTRGRKPSRGAKDGKGAPRARMAAEDGRRQSKQDAVIALLRRGQGASVDEMMEATDWQAHSVRGFMSGVLKKRLGLEVISEKDKKTGVGGTTSPR